MCTKIAHDIYKQSESEHLNFDKEMIRLKSDYIEVLDSNCVKTEFFPLKFGARFGHSICAVGAKLFIFGGFGELTTDHGKHLRQSAIEVVDLAKKTINVVEHEGKTIGDRIFHCSTLWNTSDEEQSIYITYGRSNPSRLFNSLVKLSFNASLEVDELNEKNVNLETVESVLGLEGSNDMGRFRHGACVTFDSNLFIYGGKVFEPEISGSRLLSDCYIMDKALHMKKINVKSFFQRLKKSRIFLQTFLNHF